MARILNRDYSNLALAHEQSDQERSLFDTGKTCQRACDTWLQILSPGKENPEEEILRAAIDKVHDRYPNALKKLGE